MDEVSRAGESFAGGIYKALCQNPNCNIQISTTDGPTGQVCNRRTGDWEKLVCNFSLTNLTDVQFLVRLNENAGDEVAIDDLNLYGRF